MNIEDVEKKYQDARFSYTSFSDCLSVRVEYGKTYYDAFDILEDLQLVDENYQLGQTLDNGQIFNLMRV